jgi:hypothetical protein
MRGAEDPDGPAIVDLDAPRANVEAAAGAPLGGLGLLCGQGRLPCTSAMFDAFASRMVAI